MIYCARCLYPNNHPLNLIIDEEGVCSGCRVHEEKDFLDWPGRFERLHQLADRYRSKSGKNYDCIVPVTGARDSFFTVHIVKNILKLKPLLVQYNQHYNTQVGIRNLAYLRIIFNCDMIAKVVAPQTIQALNKTTLIERGSMYWHCLAGKSTFPVQSAVFYKIPLIIFSAHQGIDQVGMFSHLDEVEMTRKYRTEHDLLNLEIETLINKHPHLDRLNLEAFQYPDDREIQAIGVRGIYLNNFLRWDSKEQHELMIDLYQYETKSQFRTFDNYNDVDCHHYSGLHDLIKFMKYGYGKATDHACREIRLKRMTREDGIKMVNRYRDIYPPDIDLFLEWMDMGKDELFEYIDQHRDKQIWHFNENNNWELKDCVTRHYIEPKKLSDARLVDQTDCEFRKSSNEEVEVSENSYTIIGRGFVDGKEPSSPMTDAVQIPSSAGIN